ncbi:hypothetical protein AN901_204522 [Pseudomonas syringae pv. theae]|nr:hypothetical protein AN901_204522 [Pseudomonas syringae pv. theae]RMP87104.1 hypothetical protein ALQ16_204720 [Pseudomonas syringae pv. actinidiae]RMS52556.1 hypothetical protein ALP64_200114 [Pseudomonas syringae pv. actinidiae]
MTPGGRVQRAGDFPFDRVITGAANIEARDLRQQRLGVRVIGPRKQVIDRCGLDHPAQVHHHHAVTQVFHHTQVVADEQIGQAQLIAQVHEQVENLRLNRHVQRCHRLVTDQQFRLHRQRTGDANTLALTTAELMRVALAQLRAEPGALQLGADILIGAFAVGQAMQQRALADNPVDPQARIEARRGVLKNHLHLEAQGPTLLRGQAVERLAVHRGAAGGHRQQPGHHAPQG